jgi:hypothetical protein
MDTENEYDKYFPTHVDLGTQQPDYGSPTVESPLKSAKKKTVYPTLYISDAPDELAKLPKTGCALIEFDRRSIKIGKSTDADGKETQTVTVELDIKRICLPEGESGDLASDFAKFAAKAGRKDAPAGNAEPEDEPEEKEES